MILFTQFSTLTHVLLFGDPVLRHDVALHIILSMTSSLSFAFDSYLINSLLKTFHVEAFAP